MGGLGCEIDEDDRQCVLQSIDKVPLGRGSVLAARMSETFGPRMRLLGEIAR